MAVQTLASLSERLGQLEARLVQIDEGQRKLRGSTDYEDRRQRASLILEGEDIETELSQLRSAVALAKAKTQNRV
jgi:hypothetical protein